MEILLVYPFLDKFVFFPQFLFVLPFIIFGLLILYSSWKNNEVIRKNKLLIYTFLFTTILLIGFFFIPEIFIINVSPSEVFLSNFLIIFRFSLFYILTLIPQAVILVYIGWKNKNEFKNYWLISAILFLINIGWEYYSKLLEKYNIINLISIPLSNPIFYFNLFFLLLSLTSFTYMFIHGIFNNQKQFTSTGVSMIFVDTYVSLMAGYVLFLVFMG